MEDKVIRMARVSARGGLNLFTGLVISNLISAVGVILIARLLTPAEYGLYSVSLTPISIVTMFRDWGVNSAMVRYIAPSKHLVCFYAF